MMWTASYLLIANQMTTWTNGGHKLSINRSAAANSRWHKLEDVNATSPVGMKLTVVHDSRLMPVMH